MSFGAVSCFGFSARSETSCQPPLQIQSSAECGLRWGRNSLLLKLLKVVFVLLYGGFLTEQHIKTLAGKLTLLFTLLQHSFRAALTRFNAIFLSDSPPEGTTVISHFLSYLLLR